jgi:hypothetical protein
MIKTARDEMTYIEALVNQHLSAPDKMAFEVTGDSNA